MASSSMALADDSAAALARARAAFEEADFDAAAKAYRVAIDAGRLAPNELAESFVSLGMASASQGNSKRALDAFRLAVIVDATVTFPSGGPKKARPLLEQARREMTKRAGAWFRVAFSERSVPVGTTAATVRVRVDAVAGLEAVEVEARSGEGEAWVQRLPLGTEVPVVLPRTLHATGRVRLRLAAIDDVGNRWAEVVRSLDVDRIASPTPPPRQAEAPAPSATPFAPVAAKSPGPATRSASTFWSSPWPWVGVGVLALGFGGAYAYAALDASGPARVGAPTVHTTP